MTAMEMLLQDKNIDPHFLALFNAPVERQKKKIICRDFSKKLYPLIRQYANKKISRERFCFEWDRVQGES
jgi:hypothetical protein